MNPPKRILFILIQPKMVDNFYDILFKKVSEKYEVHILTTFLGKEIEKSNYHYHYFNIATDNSIGYVKMVFTMYQTIKTVKPHLVIGYTIRNTIFGNIISKYLKIPTISPIVGLGTLFSGKEKVYKVARFLLPHALKKTNHVFFYNQDDMTVFLQKGLIKSSYSRIHGVGVNTEKFKPIDTPKTKDITFLLIARLLRDKGIIEYYEAAKEIHKSHDNVRFQVLGGFYDKNLSANQISRKEVDQWETEGTIEYLGSVDDVRPHIAKCSCVVLPSYREGLSNVLMEGGSMAKPLLASNVPGCKELVIDNQNGFLFEVKSKKAMVITFQKFLNLTQEEREKMGLQSRAHMVAHYDRNNSADQFIDKIDELLTTNAN